MCIFLRIFFRECRSKNADVVVLRRGFLTCAIGEIDRKYAQGFPIRTTRKELERMKRTFIEVPIFTNRWKELGLTDENLRELENALLRNPKTGDTIQGTGGIRKMI